MAEEPALPNPDAAGPAPEAAAPPPAEAPRAGAAPDAAGPAEAAANTLRQDELDALAAQLGAAAGGPAAPGPAGPGATAPAAGAAAGTVAGAPPPEAGLGAAAPAAGADAPAAGTAERAAGTDEPAAGPAVLATGGLAVSADAAVGFEPPEFDAAAPAATTGIELLDDVELDVKIELGRANMYIEDVLRLGQGSVIELDKLAGDPVDIFVNDRLIARGEVLVLNDNFCVRINEIHSPIPELETG